MHENGKPSDWLQAKARSLQATSLPLPLAAQDHTSKCNPGQKKKAGISMDVRAEGTSYWGFVRIFAIDLFY